MESQFKSVVAVDLAAQGFSEIMGSRNMRHKLLHLKVIFFMTIVYFFRTGVGGGGRSTVVLLDC